MAILRFEERAALLPEARRPRTRLLGVVLLATAAAAAACVVSSRRRGPPSPRKPVLGAGASMVSVILVADPGALSGTSENAEIT